jgi:hypothetical protein
MRTEQQIFNDLAVLCASPGYAHALAFLCLQNNMVSYGDELRGEDYAKLFSFSRLIRTEISTLLGLMARVPLDLSLPSPQQIQSLTERSHALLGELHEAIVAPFEKQFQAALGDPSANPFGSAEAMREPIFYGAESAYSFQYRDLAPRKYARDADWLQRNKGFSIAEANAVVKAILAFLNEHIMATLRGLRALPPNQWTLLDGFTFSAADVLRASGLTAETLSKVLEAFSFAGDGNPTFTTLHEFNATNAYPLLRAGDGRYILFQYSGLAEALYDTPFFWVLADPAYMDTATKNRGTFTEEFAGERLSEVFGPANVYRNVEIWRSKGNNLGEIDVLVVFADRAIVLQAKSKRLTLAARKGNDLQLQSDFRAAVQDACDQALACSQLLLSGSMHCTDTAGNEIAIPEAIKAVHPVCLVSDHYPALSFQARHFLKGRAEGAIKSPLVCDVFFLDAVTEMLETPLRCLSYLELRALASGNILFSHEHTALAFHLRQNLWMGEYDFIHLDDSISADLDIAMAVRRDGVEGKRTPEGILTALQGTSVGRILEDIERSTSPVDISVGLQLLKLSGETARDLSGLIDRIASEAAKDGRRHDATIGMSKAKSGITVHCTASDHLSAVLPLGRYCELRKYRERAQSWFGIVVEPRTGKYRFGIIRDHPWQPDRGLDEKVRRMSPGLPPSSMTQLMKSGEAPRKKKIGRNERCRCGSGLKYKKCCGRT